MQDIEQVAKQYSIDLASTLKDTLQRYSLTEFEPLFRIFIDDISKGNYFLHFNFRLVNGEISIQPRTNIGLAVTDYSDRLQGLK